VDVSNVILQAVCVVTSDCLQTDLFLWCALYPMPICSRDWELCSSGLLRSE